jgi:iron-sulfur cluster assembly protein
MEELSISERAAERIHTIRKEKEFSDEVLLCVSVVSGGCSGLTYNLDFKPDAEVKENDKLFDIDGVKVLVDMRSFLYLAGTELDYSDGFEGQGFHFRNPNASRTCSCGESFSI